MQTLEIMLAMQDDAFAEIISNDPILQELEKEKFNHTDQFFQLMMILSKVFKINGVTVSCITPAIWSWLYCTKNAYAIRETPSQIDTDIFLYILHNGIKNIDDDYISAAAGFCEKNGIDYIEAQADLVNMIYLSFRPLEMLSGSSTDQPRFNADWLTQIVSVVAPLTGKKSDEIIFDMSLTQCFYYAVQMARKSDVEGRIKRRNSDEINAAIYQRTFQLGTEYYNKFYKDK